MKNITVFDIANWFIKYNNMKVLTEKEDLISNLKLQKLLYYAQSYSLALNDKPLFNEKFEAWTHGPVIPIIYQKYKNYGSDGIKEYDDVSLDLDTEKLLLEIYDVFGKYSAWGLRELTHSEYPWINAYERKTLVNEKDMKECFKEKYVN